MLCSPKLLLENIYYGIEAYIKDGPFLSLNSFLFNNLLRVHVTSPVHSCDFVFICVPTPMFQVSKLLGLVSRPNNIEGKEFSLKDKFSKPSSFISLLINIL